MKIFLSSTFRDLRKERNAVEQTIHRMGDYYVGMEYFGATPNEPIAECLNKIEESDIVILVVGFRHGSVPKGRKKSMVELEFEHAQKLEKPIIAYVADAEAYAGKIDEELNPRLVAFRKKLRDSFNVQCYTSETDLAYQIAIDLGREIRRIEARLSIDKNGALAPRHQYVVYLIENRQFAKALECNTLILASNKVSPRAHYNQACIYSEMAELEKEIPTRAKLFAQSRSRLYDAMKHGILDLIVSFNGAEKSPHERIISDPNLQPLLKYMPELVDQIRRQEVWVPRRDCGC